MAETIKYVSCQYCPCLDSSYESQCNLGFDVELKLINNYPIYCSKNCKLQLVSWDTGVFKPKVILEEKPCTKQV